MAVVVGIGLLLYPTAADWFSTRKHDVDVSGYFSEVERQPRSIVEAIMAEGRAYNEALPKLPIAEVATLPEYGSPEAYRRYEDLLRLEPSEVIGRLHISKINVDLPIFHGTGERSLLRGVGHVYGSSLPIGGDGTHAVLSAHSGLVDAVLFTNLDQLVIGDVFTLMVGDEKLYYQVESVRTISPDDTEALVIEPDRDLVTLLTCTPTGINTHRLLVTGSRMEPVPDNILRDYAVPPAGEHAGFPWWVVALVAGALLLSVLLLRIAGIGPRWPIPFARRRDPRARRVLSS